MNHNVTATGFFLALFLLWQNSAAAQQRYSGICDASAAVAIDTAHFLVAHDEVFGDEGDTLYLYRNDAFAQTKEGADPLKKFSLKRFLQTDDKRESDIEGAAKIDTRIFWITSHGRNKSGKIRENRYRLFATDVVGNPPDLKVQFVGLYSNLAADMTRRENWQFAASPNSQSAIKALNDALRLEDKKVEALAPKKQGLNIEGLAALPDKSTLLIGLRNPVVDGKALIIPLLNPQEIINSPATSARFGEPVFLDLGGRGIRSMDYVPAIDAFLIVAGPIDDELSFRLYKWSGTPEAQPTDINKLRHAKGANPEALIAYANERRIQILDDEGSRKTDGEKCKDLKEQKRSFGDWWYVVE